MSNGKKPQGSEVRNFLPSERAVVPVESDPPRPRYSRETLEEMVEGLSAKQDTTFKLLKQNMREEGRFREAVFARLDAIQDILKDVLARLPEDTDVGEPQAGEAPTTP